MQQYPSPSSYTVLLAVVIKFGAEKLFFETRIYEYFIWETALIFPTLSNIKNECV